MSVIEQRTFIQIAIRKTTEKAQQRCQVVSTGASYSGGPELNLGPQTSYNGLGSRVFLSFPNQKHDIALN
jgi:hypothetical protein